jgi:hypothetical protein
MKEEELTKAIRQMYDEAEDFDRIVLDEGTKNLFKFDDVEEKALDSSSSISPKSFEVVLTNFIKTQEKEILDTVRNSTLTGLKAGFIDEMLKGLTAIGMFEVDIKKFIEEHYQKGLDKEEMEVDQNFFPNQEAIEFLKNYNFDLLKNMADDLKKKLSTTLQRAYMEDKPINQIKQEVMDLFDMAETRIKAIIRTETARAENYGELDGAEQSKFNKGKTIANYMDVKTSPLCSRMIRKYSDKIIDLDENFVDDETGESWKAPPFHVNCRTRLLTRIRE